MHDTPPPLLVSGRRVLTPAGMLADHEVVIERDTIVAVRPCATVPEFAVVAPGFVDIQVNGHGDIDVASADEEAWRRLGQILWSQGVTTFCPTVPTRPLAEYDEILESLIRRSTEPGPTVAGIHLEGPYIGTHHGAHSAVPEGPIDLGWLTGLPGAVCLVTLGPERSNALDAIEILRGRGTVVALGHTGADYDQTIAGFEAGATLFTHCFNAAEPMHHRRPGPVAAALTRDDVAVSLIADGVHVHPGMLRLAWNAKPADRVVLISDAVASGDPPGSAPAPPRLSDGTLAGTNLTMDLAVRNALHFCGISHTDALSAASANPAGVLGMADRGRLEEGTRADLVALTDNCNVVGTWQAGARVWPDKSP